MSDGPPAARETVWGAGWNTAGFLGAAAFNFVATLIVTRTLGVDGYARYSYLLWLVSVGSLAASAGLARPVARFVAKARGAGRPTWSNPLVRRSGVLATALGLGLGPALALAAHRLLPGFVVVPVALLTACIVSGAVASIQAAALQGRMGFRGLAFANVVSAAALCLASLAVALGRGGVEQQFAAATLAAVALVSLQSLLLARRVEARAASPGDGEAFCLPSEFRKYWLGAAGLMLIEAVVWQRPEVLFLAKYASPEQLGYYNAAWALANRLALIAMLLGPVLQAQVAGMRPSDEAGRIQALYTHSSRWLCLLAAPLFMLPAGLAVPLAGLLYGPAYKPAGLTLGILCLGAFLSTVSVAGSAIVYGTDRIGFALRWGAVAAVATLSLDFLLIPSFGAPGAAVANVGGQAFAIGATLALSLAPSGFRFPWDMFFRTLAAAVLGAVAASLVEASLRGIAGLLAAIAVGVTIYTSVVLASGVLRSDDWMLVKILLPNVSKRSVRLHAFLVWALGPAPGDRP